MKNTPNFDLMKERVFFTDEEVLQIDLLGERWPGASDLEIKVLVRTKKLQRYILYKPVENGGYYIPEKDEIPELFIDVEIGQPGDENGSEIRLLFHYNLADIKDLEQSYPDFITTLGAQRLTTDVAPQNRMDSAQTPTSGESLIPVNVPSSRWAGKTPEQIFMALKDDYAPEVIALIMQKVSNNKTECGKALSLGEYNSGEIKDEGTYRKFFVKLLEVGNSRYSLTFNK